MIQRIQTVWLLLSAMVIASALYFNVFRLADGTRLNLQDNYLAIVLIALSAILSLVALFNFKKRNAQLNMIWMNILVVAGLLVWMFFSIEDAKGAISDQGGAYQFGAFVPLICIVLLFMARSGIRKDIKLLKAYDRLR